jgi:hypothetical protein
MGESPDHLLAKVAGLVVAAVAFLAVFLVTTPGIGLAAAFGTRPAGIALGALAVVLGVAGYVALEVSAGEAFSE